jgi:hypothetical protein
MANKLPNLPCPICKEVGLSECCKELGCLDYKAPEPTGDDVAASNARQSEFMRTCPDNYGGSPEPQAPAQEAKSEYMQTELDVYKKALELLALTGVDVNSAIEAALDLVSASFGWGKCESFKPKPTPDPKAEQCGCNVNVRSDCPVCSKEEKSGKRPFAYPDDWYYISDVDALFDEQDNKIASLEKELTLEHAKLESIKATNLWMQKELNLAWSAASEYKAERDKLLATGPRFAELLVELDKARHELHIYKRALEIACEDMAENIKAQTPPPEAYLEAARKEEQG